MKATIDIKTPSGKPLEGFPQNLINVNNNLHGILYDLYLNLPLSTDKGLHPGDTITIKMTE